MNQPTLWEQQETLTTIHNIKPQLASWDKLTYPSQIRLQAYRHELMNKLHPLPSNDLPLFLHLDVSVQHPTHLVKHHDLENYLTPLFGNKLLDSKRFVLVTAQKFIGGESQLIAGVARPTNTSPTGWSHFAYTAQGSVQSKQWKENLHHALSTSNPILLTTQTVDVQLAFTCSPRRNWVNLWKVTGDCMGPILGVQNQNRPFAPNDDHIIDLKFHRTDDSTIGNDVHIDMWWRATKG